MTFYMLFLIVVFLGALIYFRVICTEPGGLSRGLFEFRFLNMNKYSSDVDNAIKILIAKYEQNLLTAEIDTFEIKFSDGSSIWIGNKYFGYGFLYAHGNKKYSRSEWRRPSVKTFRDIQKLESTLRIEKASTENDDNTTKYGSNEGENKVVL